MSLSAGGAIVISLVTRNHTTGALTDADSLPVAALYRNGNADGAVTITVAHRATGEYSASLTVPSGYAAGDRIEIRVAATVGGLTDVAYRGPWILDAPTIDANVIEVNGSPVSTSNTAIDANVIEVNGSAVSTSNTAIDANLVQIGGSATLGTAFGTSIGTIVSGAVSTASFTPTVTAFETNVAFTRTDELKGRVIVFAAGSSMGREAASISSSAVGANGNTKFTVPTMTKAAANTDAFVIV